MKTEQMQARFVGDEQEEGTQMLGLIKGGVYALRLMQPNWLQRLLGEKGVVVIVRVAGMWKEILYGSIHAFDRNWELKR